MERTGDVEVQTDIVPQGEYIEKLLVRISGGDPPDMASQWRVEGGGA